MSDKLIVEIPEFFLLTIAVHGNMGDGDLPDLMRIWAQNECRRLGIERKMINLQDEKIKELDKRLRKVLGNDAIDKLHSDIKKVARAINDK